MEQRTRDLSTHLYSYAEIHAFTKIYYKSSIHVLPRNVESDLYACTQKSYAYRYIFIIYIYFHILHMLYKIHLNHLKKKISSQFKRSYPWPFSNSSVLVSFFTGIINLWLRWLDTNHELCPCRSLAWFWSGPVAGDGGCRSKTCVCNLWLRNWWYHR